MDIITNNSEENLKMFCAYSTGSQWSELFSFAMTVIDGRHSG
jgi:hypothetical protein